MILLIILSVVFIGVGLWLVKGIYDSVKEIKESTGIHLSEQTEALKNANIEIARLRELAVELDVKRFELQLKELQEEIQRLSTNIHKVANAIMPFIANIDLEKKKE